jgi:hypothetical protein
LSVRSSRPQSTFLLTWNTLTDWLGNSMELVRDVDVRPEGESAQDPIGELRPSAAVRRIRSISSTADIGNSSRPVASTFI